jgi:hypothetical protein
MILYEPVNAELSQILASTDDDFPDDKVDDVLDRAMYLLRSWKNLENDLPEISAKNFLNKVELVERWRLGIKIESSPSTNQGSGMHRVTSTPNLSHAAASFHRHRSNEGLTPIGASSDDQEQRIKADESDFEQDRDRLKVPGKALKRSVSTHEHINQTIVIGLRA